MLTKVNSATFSRNSPLQHYMNICVVGAEMFHADTEWDAGMMKFNHLLQSFCKHTGTKHAIVTGWWRLDKISASV